jgi:proton glutamate symport protein
MKKIFESLVVSGHGGHGPGRASRILLAPTGAGLLSEKISEQIAPWIALPGNLFLSMIKMVVIPLVLTSIILGITSSDDKDFLKKVSMRIFPYFIATTMVATAIGASLSTLLQPGKYIDSALIADVMEGSPPRQRQRRPRPRRCTLPTSWWR